MMVAWLIGAGGKIGEKGRGQAVRVLIGQDEELDLIEAQQEAFEKWIDGIHRSYQDDLAALIRK